MFDAVRIVVEVSHDEINLINLFDLLLFLFVHNAFFHLGRSHSKRSNTIT